MSKGTSGRGPGPRGDGCVILTGAAGNLGRFMVRALLGDGVNVVITGRTQESLEALVHELAEEGHDPSRLLPVAADAADPEACRLVVREAVDRFGPIRGLVNNAGTAGPREQLERIPFSQEELAGRADGPVPSLSEADLAAWRDRTPRERETMLDAARNLLGGPWNMVRAALSELATGASIVNVSTIFSRTPYYGRIPYVVPKSALNALSLGLARELGRDGRGIRVNTVFPGPIESERITTVFRAMDELRGVAPETTAREFFDLMILERPPAPGEPPQLGYPRPSDVAATVRWLTSGESAAFSGHSFEVTHGMQVPAQSRSKLVSWPDMRLVDLSGRVVVILGGEAVEDVLTYAGAHLRYGAEVVLAFRSMEALERARRRVADRLRRPVHLLHVDPQRRESVERVSRFVEDRFGRLDAVLVLPARPAGAYGASLAEASDAVVEDFIRAEIVAPVAVAAALAREISRVERALAEPPAVTFVTNGPTEGPTGFAEMSRAGIEELIRVWRHEEEHDVRVGRRRFASLPNQLVRFDNHEPDNLAFAADWTATLANRVRRMDPINLWIPKQISRATGKSALPMAIERVLLGLHQGRVALITGASAGIGRQIARFLAIAGARLVIAARDPKKLHDTREAIVAELEAVGYPSAAERVAVVDGIDVGEEAAIQELVEAAVARYGRVDILINNAGIAGAEEMVVDMTVEAWERTLTANLVSNYSLLRKLAPRMKAHGEGKVLNVSSYFGGEKYVAVAYPNRADYGVSKAGQRALAEILSRHLGPEIQINALAPGPVEGGRLRGAGGSPGLFLRRGRLILENKRLNAVHGAVLDALRGGADAAELLPLLAPNAISKLLNSRKLPEPVRLLAEGLHQKSPAAASGQYLMNAVLARGLAARLQNAGRLAPEDAEAFLGAFVDAPEPFFPEDEVRKEAAGVEASILSMLHLHRMPTDEDVALSTVFYLADNNVSGETYHPSGGLKFDRSVTEGELLGRPGAEDLARLAGKRVLLVGDCMHEELAALAEAFAGAGVGAISVLTASKRTARDLKRRLDAKVSVPLSVRAGGADFDAVIDEIAAEAGNLDVVVSTPFARLPEKPLAAPAGESWDRVLSEADFAALCRDQLTHHFRVARKAALQDRCQLILVTPDTARDSTREEFALAMFVRTALHALTVTLGVEGERLPTVPAVSQVQLTRRARAEEPRTDKELSEERARFIDAVLRSALPAPTPDESRYLARIYRGYAVTV